MKPILVLYATREGHTRRIAEHLAATLTAHQLSPDVIDAAQIPRGFSLENYSAAVVSASVHLGKHESEMTKFVKRHLAELQKIPTAFLSVSLSEAGVEDEMASAEKRARAGADVKRTIDAFLAQTSWRPSHVNAVAGALMYRRYNFAVRWMMKRIARQAGAPTDTSRDHEFTDFAALDQTINEFVLSLPPPRTECGSARS